MARNVMLLDLVNAVAKYARSSPVHFWIRVPQGRRSQRSRCSRSMARSLSSNATPA